MEKRSGAVTFAGSPVTLVGPEVKVGEKAPDFKLLDNSLAEKTLKDYEGKTRLFPLYRPLIRVSVMPRPVGSIRT